MPAIARKRVRAADSSETTARRTRARTGGSRSAASASRPTTTRKRTADAAASSRKRAASDGARKIGSTSEAVESADTAADAAAADTTAAAAAAAATAEPQRTTRRRRGAPRLLPARDGVESTELPHLEHSERRSRRAGPAAQAQAHEERVHSAELAAQHAELVAMEHYVQHASPGLRPYIRHLDLEDDTILVSNPASAPARLGGFELLAGEAESPQVFRFPPDFLLGPGDHVYVHCAPGRLNPTAARLAEESPRALLWRTKSGSLRKQRVLRPKGDAVRLRDAEGVQVAACTCLAEGGSLRLQADTVPYVSHVDLAREVVVVSNPRAAPAPLGGHALSDAMGKHTFLFPKDFRLGALEDAVLLCQPGALPAAERAAAEAGGALLMRNADGSFRRAPMLNRDGDIVRLFDADGAELSACFAEANGETALRLGADSWHKQLPFAGAIHRGAPRRREPSQGAPQGRPAGGARALKALAASNGRGVLLTALLLSAAAALDGMALANLLLALAALVAVARLHRDRTALRAAILRRAAAASAAAPSFASAGAAKVASAAAALREGLSASAASAARTVDRASRGVKAAAPLLREAARSAREAPARGYEAVLAPILRAMSAVARVPPLPEVSLPKVSLPTFSLPTFSLPTFSLPTFSLPKVSLPKVSLPKVSLPKVSLPKVSLPKVSLPKVSLPKVSLPKVSLPTSSLPTFSLPTFSLPKVSVNRRAASFALCLALLTAFAALHRDLLQAPAAHIAQRLSAAPPATNMSSAEVFALLQQEVRQRAASLAEAPFEQLRLSAEKDLEDRSRDAAALESALESVERRTAALTAAVDALDAQESAAESPRLGAVEAALRDVQHALRGVSPAAAAGESDAARRIGVLRRVTSEVEAIAQLAGEAAAAAAPAAPSGANATAPRGAGAAEAAARWYADRGLPLPAAAWDHGVQHVERAENLAAAALGARVVHGGAFTSASYAAVAPPGMRFLALLGLDNGRAGRPPAAALSRGTGAGGGKKPGECWTMGGGSGFITVRLARPIAAAEGTIALRIAVEHNGGRGAASAPRGMRLWAYEDLEGEPKAAALVRTVRSGADKNGPHAAALPGGYTFEYDSAGEKAPALQAWDLEVEGLDSAAAVKLEVLDNWGNEEYTAIYRIYVNAL